jgi:glycosyltransferase involved in cell wall biosynthesis
MRIAIVGPAHPLREGGITTFNHRLAQQLQAEGHEVLIYSFFLQYPNFLFPGSSQFTKDPAPEGLKIKSILNSINPFNWIKSGWQIRKAKHDVIIVRYWLPFMGPCLGTVLRILKRKETKIICIADNMIPHEKRIGDRLFTKYFSKPIDAFICMSKKVQKDVHLFSSKPSVYTPHPLYDNFGALNTKEIACAQLNLNPNKKYILFFGFIRSYKGLDWLLEAMADERLAADGIELIVAGEFYDDAEMYQEIIQQHQLNARVHLFTQFIPNEAVSTYFSAADVVVQPYKHATQSGITQIAYHFEKPMIVTNVGGLAEGVPHGKVGFIAAPNPTSIADAIHSFYQANSLTDFEKTIKIEKAKYSWDTFTKVLLGNY